MVLRALLGRVKKNALLGRHQNLHTTFSRNCSKKYLSPGPVKELNPLNSSNEHYSSKGAYWRVYSLGALLATYLVIFSYFPFRSHGRYFGSQRDKYNFINDVVNVCAPAVVYIEILDPKIQDKLTNSRQVISNGSGFIIRKDGWLMTNAHVIISKPKAIIMAQMNDGTSYETTVEDVDMNLDLALLKINAPIDKPLPVLQFDKMDDLKVGEWVVALGSPLSLSHSVTAGVVSSVNRKSSELGLVNLNTRYIQTDAAITFGNSGGPLINLDGRVVGINNLRITSGISFAIPIEYVNRFLLRSNAYNGYKNPEKGETILGLTTIKMSPNVLQELLQLYSDYPEDVTQGILVWKVLDGGVAQQNGLIVGDIITEVNGSPIEDTADMYKFFKGKTKYPLDFKIIRRGKLMNVQFTQLKK